MIISRTPYRISFFGGGTDYPGWYQNNGGLVLATTINKYCYLSVRYLPPFFDHRYRIVYSRTELCHRVDEIKHPAVRGVLKYLDFKQGLEIHHDGDLPARSGLGSSSAFIVGLLHALYALRGKMCGKHELALESIHIEQKILRENVGAQDQTSAAYGGFNLVNFHPGGEITVNPLVLPPARLEELNSHLMLFYTRISRTSSDIAGSYAPEIHNKERQLNAYRDMVRQAQEILVQGRSLLEFGDLMHEGWELKRTMSSQVSTKAIDNVYRAARQAGAQGGKIIGAGGGGFLLLVVPPAKRAAVRERLHKLLEVPFEFERQGSQIIFYDPEPQYPLN